MTVIDYFLCVDIKHLFTFAAKNVIGKCFFLVFSSLLVKRAQNCLNAAFHNPPEIICHPFDQLSHYICHLAGDIYLFHVSAAD